MSSDTTKSLSIIKPAGIYLLVALFLLIGSIGHDPWKQDETYSFGIIYHFFMTHSWLVPMNAGEFFMEKPPLYYWTAVICMKLFGGVLPLHDAARLASVFYMGLACYALWSASNVIFASSEKRSEFALASVLLLLGSLGLVRHAHDMFTDVALLAGSCVSLLGMALLIYRTSEGFKAGSVLGLGLGIMFLSKGLMMPIVFGASGLMLLSFFSQLRSLNALKALGGAAILAAPFALIWPSLLYQESYPLFMEWFWDNNVGRFLGFSVGKLGADNKPGYILYTALWFAFPVFPLAIAALLAKRREWRNAEIILPASISIIGMALLVNAASSRALYLIPLLPAFTLLAVQVYFHIPLFKWTAAIRILLSIAAFVLFEVWCELSFTGFPQLLAHRYENWLPRGYHPAGGQIGACLIAGVFVMLWLASFRLDAKSHVNTAYIWLAGLALLWALPNTLLMPWLNETKSFRTVFAELSEFLGKPPYEHECIARYQLGESAAPMWEYFGKGRGLGPIASFENAQCPLLLQMTSVDDSNTKAVGWRLIWKGSRALDDKDEFRLFERDQ